MSSGPLDSGGAGSQLKDSLADASRRVQSIIDEAEQTAREAQLKARADAEREAERLVDARIAAMNQMTTPLIDRIESLKAQVSQLSHEIDGAGAQMRAMLDQSHVEPSASQDPSAPVDSLVVESGPAYESPAVVEAPPVEEPSSTAEEFRSSADIAPPSADESPAPVAYPGTGTEGSSGPPSSAAAAEAEPQGPPPEEALLRATQMAVAGSPRQEIEATLTAEFGLEDSKAVVDDILGTA